jgi:hypothetical protein
MAYAQPRRAPHGPVTVATATITPPQVGNATATITPPQVGNGATRTTPTMRRR